MSATTSYPIVSFVNHYPIVDIDGQTVFLDLGCDVSLCRKRSISVMGKTYPCYPYAPDKYGREIFSAEIFSNDINRHSEVTYTVDAVLGTDILSHYQIVVDYPGKAVTFSSEPLTLEGETVPVSFNGAHLFADCTIGGKPHHALLDTGARFGYVLADAVADKTCYRHDTDFNPIVQKDYNVDIYLLTAKVGSFTFTADFGRMEIEDIITQQAFEGCDSTIGYDFFAGQKVGIDFQREILILAK